MALHEGLRENAIVWQYDDKYNNIRSQYKPWKPESQLKLQQTPNTPAACRLCRGTKFVITDNSTSVKQIVCPACLGRGIIEKGYEAAPRQSYNNR